MEFTDELTGYLTGGTSAAYVVAAFFFVLLGALINVLYDAQTRVRRSEDVPELWCWKFFWRDNRQRFFLNFLMALVVIRFWTEFTGHPLSLGYCFLTGLVFDAMFVVYKKLRRRITNVLDKISDNNNF
jgi:uncharacterized membrane protein